MRKSGSFALLLVVIAGCGGPAFRAAPAEDAAEPPLPDAGDARDRGADSGGGSALDASSGQDVANADASDARDPDEDSDAVGGDSALDAKQAGDAGEEDARVDAGACAPLSYFLDRDGDGYGGTTTVKACVPPGSGVWVTSGGDCDDGNATVNPGQSAYFSAGYVPTGKSSLSFDYNCDGDESESGTPAKASCQLVSLSCAGSGYIEASPVRSGSGVDAFCGSTEAVSCALSSLSCKAGAPYAVSPVACH